MDVRLKFSTILTLLGIALIISGIILELIYIEAPIWSYVGFNSPLIAGIVMFLLGLGSIIEHYLHLEAGSIFVSIISLMVLIYGILSGIFGILILFNILIDFKLPDALIGILFAIFVLFISALCIRSSKKYILDVYRTNKAMKQNKH